MEPNDLPIVVLPLELSDESAAILIEFLHNFADALERHYAAQLMRYTKSRSTTASPLDPPF
jgi:hypothetical protein